MYIKDIIPRTFQVINHLIFQNTIERRGYFYPFKKKNETEIHNPNIIQEVLEPRFKFMQVKLQTVYSTYYPNKKLLVTEIETNTVAQQNIQRQIFSEVSRKKEAFRRNEKQS